MKMKNTQAELTRRNFLKTVGKAGLSSQFLRGSTFATGMMLGRAASAQTTNIKRVVCVYIGDGAPVNGTNLWLPSDDLVLPATTAPLESVKEHCVFFKNATIVDGSGAEVGGHGNTSKAFGGSGFSNSYDVELERTIGASSPFPSLLLGVQSNGHGSATKKDGSEIVYQDNPEATFNRLFNGNVNTSSIGVQRAQSVLDVNKEEIATLQSILGSSEQSRLEEHLASVEKIESRLILQAESEALPECTSPTWNSDNYVYNANDKTHFTVESELQVDLAVLALKCNLTNVVSIMFGNHQSEHAVAELNYTGDYHQSIHGGSTSTYSETRAYLSSRLAYVIESLANATDENGESLLDSTLVLQSTDMGDGNAHSSTIAPVMMAGGGSAIRGGQVVECGRHTNMFDTASEAMGISSQVTQFGTGALSGIIV